MPLHSKREAQMWHFFFINPVFRVILKAGLDSMSYANSNPFYTQGNSSNPPASTSKATERRLLFTGLPPDVKDQDVSVGS